MAEKFYAKDKSYSIAVSGGGSGLSIASLYNGQADVANSSRPLKALFERKGIKLIINLFAEDATAIVVNLNIPIDEIDVVTLSKIFSGEITNWQSILGRDLPINIYGRQSSSGTHSFVQKKLGIAFTQYAKEMNGNAQIMEAIKVDPSGIGYVGAGYLLGGSGGLIKVKPLKVKETQDGVAVSPLDHKAISAGKYFFQRTLFQLIPETSWDKVKTFIEYEKSEEGKRIIRNSGYYVVD